MKNLKEILVESNIDTTYHYTTLRNMWKIIDTWHFKSNTDEDGINLKQTNNKYERAISLTRTRRCAEGYTRMFNDKEIFFVFSLNNRMLSSKYKIKPFDYLYNAAQEYGDDNWDTEYCVKPNDTGRRVYNRESKNHSRGWNEWAETEERLYTNEETVDVKKYIHDVSMVFNANCFDNNFEQLNGEVSSYTRNWFKLLIEKNPDLPFIQVLDIVEACRQDKVKLVVFDSIANYNKNKSQNIVVWSNTVYNNLMRAAKELLSKGDINEKIYNSIEEILRKKLGL